MKVRACIARSLDDLTWKAEDACAGGAPIGCLAAPEEP
jgi:hypothetical protein